jgi:predicted ester cyclase
MHIRQKNKMVKYFYAALLFTTSFLSGCSLHDQKGDLDDNRNVVKKYHEVWSNGQLIELDTILGAEFVCHFINGIEWKGIDGAKKSIASHRKSFPDWKEEIVDMVSEGDKVVTRYKSTGTHQGNFNGVDSTGNNITIYETSIYRIADGKIVEQWGFPDALSLDLQVKAKN